MKISDSLKRYRKDLQIAFKNNPKLNESGTRLLVNDFLKQVLGYTANEDIKTEYEIGGGYADYVVQIGKKKKFVVEVKACGIKLNEHHLRQSLGYAAEEGIDWILLLNGRQFQLYKVIFAKPVSTKLVFDLDLLNDSDFKKCADQFELLSKKCMVKNTLEEYWRKVDSLSPDTLSKYLFDESVLKLLRKNLKTKIGIHFSAEDIANALYEIVTTQLNMNKPKVKTSTANNKAAKNSAKTAQNGVLNTPNT
jgi:predicted type IV restriction endonuclease